MKRIKSFAVALSMLSSFMLVGCGDVGSQQMEQMENVGVASVDMQEVYNAAKESLDADEQDNFADMVTISDTTLKIYYEDQTGAESNGTKSFSDDMQNDKLSLNHIIAVEGAAEAVKYISSEEESDKWLEQYFETFGNMGEQTVTYDGVEVVWSYYSGKYISVTLNAL